MIEKRVRETIARYDLLRRGERIVIAVSGGVDSVVLLSLLSRIAPELGLSLRVAHLDHALRASSAEDARFVEDLAADLGLPVISDRVDVRAYAREHRLGLEEAARVARRSFLDRVAIESDAARIAVGHTADDQAETVLFRLARGTGVEGLGGMTPASGRYVRPLLRIARADVRAYAEERGLSWREDPTNVDVRFARNRVRHRVLPELARINPDVVEALGRTAELADETHDAMTFLVETLWPGLRADETADEIVLSRAAVRALPESVQALVLREAIRRVRDNLEGIERAHVHAARRLVASPRARGTLDLPRTQLHVTADEIVFSREAVPPHGFSAAWSLPLSLGHTSLPEHDLEVDLAVGSPSEALHPPVEADRWAEAADADRVVFPLLLRTRRRGDRFAPLGMGGDVRLKDFLINQSVPYETRWDLPLLCDREKILWVAGVRLSDRVKVSSSTQRILRMRIRRTHA